MSSIFAESENFDFEDSLNEFFENSSIKNFEKPIKNSENIDKNLSKNPKISEKISEKSF